MRKISTVQSESVRLIENACVHARCVRLGRSDITWLSFMMCS